MGSNTNAPARGRFNMWLGVALGAASITPAAAHGQTAESAFLFAYRPKAEMEARFEEGYRSHLAWHREAGDPFAWYGWYVTTGDAPDVFVDGTFGPTPAEFDRRVSPGEDAAHFAETTAPFAEALWRRVYRSRPDLGTSRFLEERRPSAAMRVLRYELEPGMAGAFAAFLGRLAATRAETPACAEGNAPGSARSSRAGADSSTCEPGDSAAAAGAWAAYELADGGSGPEFMLLLPAEGLAGVESGGPVAWLEAQAGGEAASGEIAGLGIRGAISATWRFREDLTYIPMRSRLPD